MSEQIETSSKKGRGRARKSLDLIEAMAAIVADGFVKGARVYLEGKLSLNEWTASDGTTRTGLSVLSWHCRLSQIGRAKSEKPKPTPQSTPSGAAFNDDIPFAPEWRG